MSKRTEYLKCFKPFEGVKCSKELRNLSIGIIDNLRKCGYCEASKLNTSFRICSTCRLKIDQVLLSISSEEQCAIAVDEECVPGTSEMSTTAVPEECVAGSSKVATTNVLPDVQSSESLPTIPSATTVSTDSSIEDFSQTVNIEIFNRGIAGLQINPSYKM